MPCIDLFSGARGSCLWSVAVVVEDVGMGESTLLPQWRGLRSRLERCLPRVRGRRAQGVRVHGRRGCCPAVCRLPSSATYWGGRTLLLFVLCWVVSGRSIEELPRTNKKRC